MLTHLQSVFLLFPLLAGLSSAGPVLQARADVCGSKGYDKGKSNYNYDNSGKFGSYAACSTRCSADSKCKSFGFSSTECLLFSVALTGNFDAAPASPDTYYDRGCIAKTSSTSSTKTLTTRSTVNAGTTSAAATPTSPSTVTSTSATATTPSIPAGCTAPPTYQITSFKWFNSTNNLDCVAKNYPADAQVCWNSASNTLCDAGSSGCTCTPYCYTGLAPAAYQPLGYGPPDTISIGTNGGSCAGQLSTGFRDKEIGTGQVNCGTAAYVMGFTGDSNRDSGSTGTVSYKPYGVTCGGSQPTYGASFPLLCSRDAGGNATCTASLPVTLALTGI